MRRLASFLASVAVVVASVSAVLTVAVLIGEDD